MHLEHAEAFGAVQERQPQPVPAVATGRVRVDQGVRPAGERAVDADGVPRRGTGTGQRHQGDLPVVDQVDDDLPDVEQPGGRHRQRGQVLRARFVGTGQEPAEGAECVGHRPAVVPRPPIRQPEGRRSGSDVLTGRSYDACSLCPA